MLDIEDRTGLLVGATGKRIAQVLFSEEELRLTMEDGTAFRLWDDGQNCCENRYMTCDDDVSTLVGAVLLIVEVVRIETEADEYRESHETAFLKVKTNRGDITVCTHNKYDGCYGGFSLQIEPAGEDQG